MMARSCACKHIKCLHARASMSSWLPMVEWLPGHQFTYAGQFIATGSYTLRFHTTNTSACVLWHASYNGLRCCTLLGVTWGLYYISYILHVVEHYGYIYKSCKIQHLPFRIVPTEFYQILDKWLQTQQYTMTILVVWSSYIICMHAKFKYWQMYMHAGAGVLPSIVFSCI